MVIRCRVYAVERVVHGQKETDCVRLMAVPPAEPQPNLPSTHVFISGLTPEQAAEYPMGKQFDVIVTELRESAPAPVG